MEARTSDGGAREFLVRWAGYSAEHDSWELSCSFLDRAPIEAFEAARRPNLSSRAGGGIPNPFHTSVVGRPRDGRVRRARCGSLGLEFEVVLVMANVVPPDSYAGASKGIEDWRFTWRVPTAADAA